MDNGTASSNGTTGGGLPSTSPPPPDVSVAPRLVIITSLFTLLALPFYITRMYSRIWILRNVWWDDWVISAAVIFALTEWIIQMIEVPHGYGRHSYYLSFSDVILNAKLGLVTRICYIWAVTLVKTSIPLMLLRIKRSPPWFWGLSCLIGFQIATGIGRFVAALFPCTPFKGNWDPTVPNRRCWTPSQIQASVYVGSVINIVSDVIFACLPLVFISQVRRPMREKVVLVLLMAFGLFASVASILKLTATPSFNTAVDATWHTVDVAIWSNVEQGLGIIGACIPCLKSLFEGVLARLGLMTVHDSTVHKDNLSGETRSIRRLDIEDG